MKERNKITVKIPLVKKENSNFQIKRPESSQSKGSPIKQILDLQGTFGNQAVQRLFKSGVVQAKLRIGHPNDIYEQEADRVAEQVMQIPDPLVQRQQEKEEKEEEVQTKPLADQIATWIQRQVDGEEKEEKEETLQAKGHTGEISKVTPDLESCIQSLKGRGRPLQEKTQDYFESRFSHDFSQVRVHTDTRSIETTRVLNAKAFTLGSDIAFGSGQYDPETSTGQRLLAHELTHVVQQSKQPHHHNVQRWPREVNTEIIIAIQKRQRGLLGMLESAIDQYASQYNVPANLLRGIIHYETQDRGLFETVGEIYKIAREDWRVSLGSGDVQVRRAAEIIYPGRDWSQNPLTPQEFSHIVGQLGTPDDHARLLASTMQDNFRYYGRQPGKRIEDRWRFAIARHKAGHGPVGRAQERARNEGRNLNTWSDVSQYMDENIVQFVNNVAGYSSTRLLENPYQ